MKKYKSFKGKTLLALAIILSMIFVSCEQAGDAFDSAKSITKNFSEKATKLGKGLLGKFKGSNGKNSFFKILSAKVANREEGENPMALLVDDGITYDLTTSMLDGKGDNPGKLTAVGYSKEGDKKVIVTANVTGADKEYSNVKVRMAIQKNGKWVTIKENAEEAKAEDLSADAFGTPETWKDAKSLPVAMQGVWTQKMQVPPGMEEFTMDMYFKYVPAKDGKAEHLEMLMPGMPEMPEMPGNGNGGEGPGGEGPGGEGPGGEGPGGEGPGGEGPGGEGPGGEGPGGEGPGGEGPGDPNTPPTPPGGRGAEDGMPNPGEMPNPGNGGNTPKPGETPNMEMPKMPVPKGAQFKWSVKMPSEITFIITDSTLEPVFPEVKDAKLTIAKVKKNGKEVDATLDANCDLAKAQTLFEAMHLEPQNKNVKPMDILWIKEVDAKTYDVVIAQTMELPKPPKNATEEEKKEFEKNFIIPEELKAYVKDGFSLTAYEKLRLSVSGKKLKMRHYDLFSQAGMGDMNPGNMNPGEGNQQPQQPSEEDIKKQQKEMMENMTTMFDFEKVKALGKDKLAKEGEEFSPVK